ncbi:hypothetical protein M514_16371 [Trichuris suis]|uniref:Uncharacterized protein n=1 Tax=Trichuris suis TaxID=68888 RepID=A0A085NPP3_9BILA|nr:hypothetical protein M514_16371 [Trichuris suis]
MLQKVASGPYRHNHVGRNPVEVEVIIAGTKPLGFDFILGVNGIAALGGVTVDAQRRVWFGSGGPTGCAVVDAEMRVDERDFTVSYNRDTHSWTASWKWSEGVEPGILRNTVQEYSPADGARPAYEEELQKWIDSGWLVPYDERKYGEPKGLIPLMAVVQRNKHKVRPVMDFRELNRHIETFTADSDVCAEKLREWRRQGANVSLIDLKKAYLQICVDQSLWPYQTVVFKRRRVWVDASSLAIGVALEVDGAIVEDASWLRSDEASHINMAELDAVVKGLNLAISWRMSKIQLVTDSSTVHRWITDGLSGKTRLRTKASSEMLIRRRIGIVLSLVQEYSLDLSVKLVKSAENKADVLTRVPQRWSRILGTPTPVCATAIDEEVESRIAEIHHNSGHPGVRRTLYFVRKVCPSVSRRQVRQVIVGCEACQSIDPAPVKWRRGSLSVEKVWQRSHRLRAFSFRNLASLGGHTSADVVEQVESVFCERGAPEELLTDNDTAFRNAHMSHPGTVSLRGAIGLSKS